MQTAQANIEKPKTQQKIIKKTIYSRGQPVISSGAARTGGVLLGLREIEKQREIYVIKCK
jgi:hypothetical protein